MIEFRLTPHTDPKLGKVLKKLIKQMLQLRVHD